VTGAPAGLAQALQGRYRIERELGQGGMATVYLARDLRHERQVAVKVLRPELAAVIGAERFLREIKTTANLQHPHILGLIDSGEVDGTAYYVMPFVEGESLRDRLTREKQLPVPDAVRIAREVASALDYAHRHGVIHRDIKPENILLHDGSALVADFGIALAVSKTGGTRMTETGLSLGTPHYMSPEQAMGEREITARSDVYALGATTYEMLAGEPPFTGPTAQAIIARVMTAEPQGLVAQRKSVPPAVEAAVFTALEKLPADRFASAAEFAAALTEETAVRRPATGTHAAGVRTRQRSITERVLAVVATLATLAAVALGVKAFGPAAAPLMQLHLDLPNLRVHHVGFYGSAFALSPDGRRIVYVAGGAPGPTHIAVRDLASLQPRTIEGSEGGDGPFFSPDGRWVAYLANGRVFKAPAEGGAPVQLATGASIILPSGTWLADDRIVFTGEDFGLKAVPAGGGAVTEVLPGPPDGIMTFPVKLPRRDALLFTLCSNNCASAHVIAVDLRTQAMDTVARNAARGYYLPSGHLVVLQSDGTVAGAPFDLGRLTVTGALVPVLNGVQLELGVVPEITVADDGTLVYLPASVVTGVGTIARVDRAGRERVIDPAWQARFTSIALSPDGRRLAVSTAEPGGNVLWVKQLDRGPLTRLSFDGTINYRPAWLPDGRTLTFSSDRDGPRTYLYRVRADGSDQPVRLFPHDTSQVDEAAWSADGKWVVYRNGTVPGVRDIHARRIDADTARVTVAAGRADEYMPTISPDGRWVAYVSLESGREEVFVRPFPDAERARTQVSIAGGAHPVWAWSGKELYYVERADTLMAVGVGGAAEFAPTYRRPLFSTRPFVLFPFHQGYVALPGDDGFIIPQRSAAPVAEARRLVVVLNWTPEAAAQLRRRP
jgi:Tol biopolymer transport system component/tRNA A-37 threonylcarbamoyl transferase component Bud32